MEENKKNMVFNNKNIVCEQEFTFLKTLNLGYFLMK